MVIDFCGDEYVLVDVYISGDVLKCIVYCFLEYFCGAIWFKE